MTPSRIGRIHVPSGTVRSGNHSVPSVLRSGHSTGAVEDSQIVLKSLAMHQLHPGEQELLKTVKLH